MNIDKSNLKPDQLKVYLKNEQESYLLTRIQDCTNLLRLLCRC